MRAYRQKQRVEEAKRMAINERNCITAFAKKAVRLAARALCERMITDAVANQAEREPECADASPTETDRQEIHLRKGCYSLPGCTRVTVSLTTISLRAHETRFVHSQLYRRLVFIVLFIFYKSVGDAFY